MTKLNKLIELLSDLPVISMAKCLKYILLGLWIFITHLFLTGVALLGDKSEYLFLLLTWKDPQIPIHILVAIFLYLSLQFPRIPYISEEET